MGGKVDRVARKRNGSFANPWGSPAVRRDTGRAGSRGEAGAPLCDLLPVGADTVDLATAAAYLPITKLGADMKIAIDVDGGRNFAPQQTIVLKNFAGALSGPTSAAMLQEMIDRGSLVF